MTDARIQIEVQLGTATLDGIELQWLLDPSTDVAAGVSTYVQRAVGRGFKSQCAKPRK